MYIYIFNLQYILHKKQPDQTDLHNKLEAS